MTFAADIYCAEFGGVKIFTEQYGFSRAAAIGEAALLDGHVSLRNGGGKAARIVLEGTSAAPCAHMLDALLCAGTAVDLTYGGMVFKGAVLVDYACRGESGMSERVHAEFVCTSAVAQKGAEA